MTRHLPAEADERQLDRVLALVADVLGVDVRGAWLFGSAVVGGLRPDSDLDLLVLTARPTTREQQQRLVDRLLAISGRPTPDGRRRRVELTVVVESDVRPWRYPPRFDFQYGDWLRTEFAAGELEPWPTKVNPDLATLLTMVLLTGRPVLGPPAGEVLDPVPRSDLVRACRDSVPELLEELDSDTRNVVLTLARIWSTVATGEIVPKDAAADWALARLPEEHRPVLERACASYLGEAREHWDDLEPRVRPFAEHVVGELERLRI